MHTPFDFGINVDVTRYRIVLLMPVVVPPCFFLHGPTSSPLLGIPVGVTFTHSAHLFRCLILTPFRHSMVFHHHYQTVGVTNNSIFSVIVLPATILRHTPPAPFGALHSSQFDLLRYHFHSIVGDYQVAGERRWSSVSTLSFVNLLVFLIRG